MKSRKKIVVVLVALTLLGAVGTVVGAWDLGYRMYAVQSGSMAPTYRPGDLVLDAPAGGPYEVGEVLTFESQGGGAAAVTTHRVYSVTGSSLETKGDANRAPDVAAIGTDEVVGKVVGVIPRAGFVMVFFRQPTGAPALMAAISSLALLWRIFFPESGGEDRVAARRKAGTGKPAFNT